MFSLDNTMRVYHASFSPRGIVKRCALLSFQENSILVWVTNKIQLFPPRHRSELCEWIHLNGK